MLSSKTVAIPYTCGSLVLSIHRIPSNQHIVLQPYDLYHVRQLTRPKRHEEQGEDNHLATAMACSLRVDYSHIGAEAGMVMKKASGGDFSLWQGAGKSSRTVRDGFSDGGGVVNFRRFLFAPLGFSRDGEYMGEEAESEATWWAQTHARRSQDRGRPA